tara:strand:- start:253 stop:543 length:291 start_codon:yes stop_codon:yes gene_type:complete
LTASQRFTARVYTTYDGAFTIPEPKLVLYITPRKGNTSNVLPNQIVIKNLLRKLVRRLYTLLILYLIIGSQYFRIQHVHSVSPIPVYYWLKQLPSV